MRVKDLTEEDSEDIYNHGASVVRYRIQLVFCGTTGLDVIVKEAFGASETLIHVKNITFTTVQCKCKCKALLGRILR